MEKPFRCPMSDCDLSFANEDHLTVHKKKHELSLTLNSAPTFKNLVDQTPTPTRFLNGLDSLEFQDLNDNPFDATFRRANSTGAASVVDIPESSSLLSTLPDSEVLNTPSITLPSEPPTPITLRPPFLRKHQSTIQPSSNVDLEKNGDSQPFSSQGLSATTQLGLPNKGTAKYAFPNELLSSAVVENSESLCTVLSRKEEDAQKQGAKNVLQTSVITSVGNSAVLKNNTGGVPTAVVVTRPVINSIATLSTTQVSSVTKAGAQLKVAEPASTIVQPVCVAPMVQLMIRLPDGQTVQLPVVASAPPTNTQPQTVAPIAPLPQVLKTSSSNAKMKLKEVLVTGKKTVVQSTTASMFEGNLSSGSIGSASPPSSPVSKRRKRRDFCDPEEKRRRCLERNRAAATRCREKRKMWVTALERKAEEMAHINTQLQREVKYLRNEVANLKTMLLAHKDCPVTMQQKAQLNYERENCTTIRIITSTAEELQLVPNNPSVSPLNTQFLEMEVASVQSSSDTSSLASEASELSYKER